MLIQVDLDVEYCMAYDIIARSHQKSRRQYVTEFLMRAADKVPGLMARVRDEMSGEAIEQESDAEVRPYSNALLPQIVERKKLYRFKYLDDTLGYVEGIGSNAGPALQAATGRRWQHEEYVTVFRDPEFVKYVEEQ